MRAYFNRMFFCQANRFPHCRRIGGMKTTGNIGEIDMRHHRHIVTEAVQSEALAHIAIDRQAHARDISPVRIKVMA